MAEQDNKKEQGQAPKASKKAAKEEKALKAKLEETSKKLEELQKENSALKEQVEAGRNDYLRLHADLDNVRRRAAQDRIDLVKSAASDTIKGMLPVLDDCERAMALLAESSDDAAKEGTALIYNKLMGYLKTRGLEKIEAKGAAFDTDFHEAVAQLPVQDEEAKGKVFDVIETGYMLGGKVLRYAKVVVGV